MVARGASDWLRGRQKRGLSRDFSRKFPRALSGPFARDPIQALPPTPVRMRRTRAAAMTADDFEPEQLATE